MEGRKQFTFYRSYYEAVKAFGPRRRLRVLEALICYALDSAEPVGLDPVENMAFVLMRPTMDAGRERARCGKIGGSKPKANSKQTKSKIENETEIEKEIESESEKEEDPAGDCERKAGFENFWSQYPVKLGKKQAWEAWQEMDPDWTQVVEGLGKWKNSRQWQQEGGRFIPRGAKFLRERHFEHCPGQKTIWGASGQLGQAELEAIEQILQEGCPPP